MKKVKRITAFVMSLVLIMTMLPALSVSAAEVTWPQLQAFNAERVTFYNSKSDSKVVQIDKIEIVQYEQRQVVGETDPTYYAGEVVIYVSQDYSDFSSVKVLKNEWSVTAVDSNNGFYKNGSAAITIGKNSGFINETTLIVVRYDEDGTTWADSSNYYVKMALSEGAEKPTEKYDLTAGIVYDDRRATHGTVVFKDKDGNAITKAEKGVQVTAVAVPDNLDYEQNPQAYQEFRFVEWTNEEGITINDNDKTNAQLTFSMPEKAVKLTAKFERIGTTVSWSSTPTGAPEVQVNDAYYCDEFPNREEKMRTGGQAILTFRDSDWIGAGEWELIGWTVKVNGEDKSNDSTLVSRKEGAVSATISSIPEGNVEVIANFKQHTFASVSTTVNDSTMGTATAVVGDGTPAASIPVVFEDQVVTLTATPGARYMLDKWEVKDADGTTITVTTDSQDSNKATFTMPGTGKDITAKAYFKVDPNKASQKNELTGVSLYAADGSTLIKAADKTGTAFTITLPEDQDTTDLASFVLKFTISDYATIKVKGAEENWATNGKACNMTLDNPVTFVVTAENGATQEYTVEIKQERTLSSEKEITAVNLLNGTSTIATGTLSGSTWTIDLPSDIDTALLQKIGTATDVFMQIDYTGASVAQEEGYSDASAAENMKWSSGKVMCGISPNSQAHFTVTAEDSTTKDYVIKITYTAPASSTPVLSAGAVERTSDTAATVSFTSSAAGSYYYRVVESGAAEPEIATTGSGTSAVAGTNTISLTTLSAGARDIYIVVKSADGKVSDSLKIAIPAFGDDSGDNTPTDPDTGDFTITVSCPTGGTITTSRTKANRGDEITVTATPDSGYQMVAGSLKFTLGVAGGESTVITDGKFTMPSCDVTVSCKWEKVQTVVNGITSFSIDGVQGVVDNTTNTISVVMPYGTDVTQLIPTISGSNISSISPASGKMVNFTKPVIYTVTLADGTTKQYTVTVYVQKGTAADEMWDSLTDFYNQTPWWEYAEHQTSSKYPKYW